MVEAEAGEVDRGRVEDAAHGDDHVLLGDVGLFDDQLEEAGAFLLLLFEQFVHLLGGQQAVLHEGVGDAFSEGFGDGWHGGLAEGFAQVFDDFRGRAPDTRAGGSWWLRPSSLMAWRLNGLAVATRTDLLMRSKGRMHQRRQMSPGNVRVRSRSTSYLSSGRKPRRDLSDEHLQAFFGRA